MLILLIKYYSSHNAGQEVTEVLKAIISVTVNMFIFADHPDIEMSDYNDDFMSRGRGL
jgi:hypothetical protein